MKNKIDPFNVDAALSQAVRDFAKEMGCVPAGRNTKAEFAEIKKTKLWCLLNQKKLQLKVVKQR